MTPLLPQNWFELPGRHVVEGPVGSVTFASQQPFRQLAGVQMQDWSGPHSRPAGQLIQVTPPVPHAVFAVPGLQVLFSQQPFRQLAGVQMQDWSGPHSRPAGQLIHTAPPVPHAAFAVPNLEVLV